MDESLSKGAVGRRRQVGQGQGEGQGEGKGAANKAANKHRVTNESGEMYWVNGNMLRSVLSRMLDMDRVICVEVPEKENTGATSSSAGLKEG